ncbi:AsmA family protein [Kangiella shandongensis]|uniref:AsmA-like C-terminal region-containing protein n=1 Tax=Kangiella shandongensis TaxID=2763258 RepID=UPI001CBB66E5|nr:AsmA-like C-terminal region-containing protein [Kangiella shandongensis]
MTKSWKWFKRVLWVLLSLFVLLFLAVSVLVYLVNSEAYLEGYISDNFGLKADIGELDVSLFSGTINVSSSVIGPKDKPYIQFDSLKGELDYSELWSSRLTVERVELTNTKLRYPFEFQLKESDEPESEDSSLLFDFINVTAIDINNFDFIYEDGVSLVIKNANVQILDLPVAEEGFLLFGDLERLVKASKTRVDASIGSLSSDKSQLNQLELHAFVDKEQLIIESLKSGHSNLMIDLLDHSATSSAPATVAQADSEPLQLPFNDVMIKHIALGKTNLAIKDKEPLSIKNIEASFNELLLVKDKQALWLDWPQFYQSQNSRFELRTDVMESSVLGYQVLELKGRLKESTFTFPELHIKQPTVTVQSSTAESSSPETSAPAIFLPFKRAVLKNGTIEQASFEYTQGEEHHQVQGVNIELSELPLIRNNKPIFDDNKLDVGQTLATIQLENASYNGNFGQIEQVASHLSLQGADLSVKTLALMDPVIRYRLPDSPAVEETASASEATPFALNSIQLEQLAVSGAGFEVTQDDSTYAGTGVNIDLRTVPVYAGSQWVIAQPNQWQGKTELELEAATITLPQGRLQGITAASSIENQTILVHGLALQQADLAVVAKDEVQSAEAQDQPLPIDTVELQGIDLNNISFTYQQQEEQYSISNADIRLQSLPLIRNGQLLSQPADFMQSGSNQLSFNIASITIPQGTIRGLSTQGVLRQRDLSLDHFITESAEFKLTLPKAVADDTSSDEGAVAKTQSETEAFILRTFKVADLKLQNTNAEVTQQTEEGEVQTRVNNLYLGATELMLVKNNQTIDQWYGSQLENAFSLIALNVEHVQQKQNDIRDLTVTAVQSNQNIRVKPLRLTYNEAPLSAEWNIDLSQQPYHSTYVSTFNDLALEKLIEPADEKSAALSGQLDGDINLEFDGLEPESILSSLQGSILVENQTLVTLHRLNVNEVLRSFLDSQSFGLLDIGGFLLAGPVGLLASQGVSLQDTLSQLGADRGDTLIPNMHVDMTLDQGVLQTKDVAVATEKYRFAFNGQIDLGKQEFNDFEFDIINEKGCSEYGQTLNGSLASPEIETFTAAFDAVTGSVVGLFKQGVGLLTGGACSSVYDGEVPHPEEGVEIIPKDKQRTFNEEGEESGSEDSTNETENDEGV